ncbi:phenylacetate--CoA ligase family protein [Flavobacterium aquariorum]|nr:phenylacetate--CoA ligase family protein [Flavobacterium aquariorum]
MKRLYNILPHFIQNLLISLYNILAYKKRYGGNYSKYFKGINQNYTLSKFELEKIQQQRFSLTIEEAMKHSSFYQKQYSKIENPNDIKNITQLPILSKEMLRQNIEQIKTIDKRKGILSKTGGTTGKAIEVIFTLDNIQERYAFLDNFRSQYGYVLGKRTAWFSGKALLSKTDTKKKRFWKTDYWFKVRYYSTFHIKTPYLKYYLENLIQFKPEYIIGFPSSILEIAKYGIQNGYHFPPDTIKAIFPTAETITEEIRNCLEVFFKTVVYNQYASSEGAPFIFECSKNNLHLEMQSGVYEVLDQNNNPTKSGKLIVTSFTTKGTPLIRYDIGDDIELSDNICTCGNNNPIVKTILGRTDDYVYSKENGKINLGNISNTLKETKGIIQFQVIQNYPESILIKLIIDSRLYNSSIEKIFVQNWRDRVGNEIHIELEYVSEIPNEISGKYRMVKNNIKHLIDV